MVYSVFYYGMEAITRAILGFTLKLYEIAKKKEKEKVVKKKKKEAPAPTWGFFSTVNMYNAKEYTWVGKSTNLKVSIPSLIKLPIKAHETAKPPERLYFTFGEAASPDWFKEIEHLAELIEKSSKGGKGAS